MEKENLNYAVYWNNEYIGEAGLIKFIKPDKKSGTIFMPTIMIIGKLQIKR